MLNTLRTRLIRTIRTSIYTLSILQPLFKKHMLENLCFCYLLENYSFHKFDLKNYEDFFKAMKDHKLFNLSIIHQPKDWKNSSMWNVNVFMKLQIKCNNQEKDLRLFAASISLARLFQGQYRSRSYLKIKHISFRPVESEEVYSAIINISDPILRIIAYDIILEMKDPLIFDEEQRDKLRYEMISLLQSLLPSLSLQTSTLLFIRCHTVRLIFPTSFNTWLI